MQAAADLVRGWRGVCLVVITYVYFLIFAQFAFLHRLDQSGILGPHLQLVMASMACAGIASSLATAYLRWLAPASRLRLALTLCAVAALLALAPQQLATAVFVSTLIGLGLGLLTVTLVTHLRLWIGAGNTLLQVGFGTGIAYLICNLPPLFTASSATQSIVVACMAVCGLFIVGKQLPQEPRHADVTEAAGFLLPLAAFTALVWFDSAAFFIIQSTPELKAGTWLGSLHLWGNGVLHLVAAVASALLLRRFGLPRVLCIAAVALGAACLLLHPGTILLASLLYPVGVSMYSVALVAYPALLLQGASTRTRSLRAGWLYAIAGWMGSALGIGMAQHLGHVPGSFVLGAPVVVMLPAAFQLVARRRREVTLVVLMLAAAYGVDRVVSHRRTVPQLDAVERGRQVYIVEGCIHCHSQYVRPGSKDVDMWGPTQTLSELRRQRPPLIGNRRQGPDLSQVGSRRSPLWLKAHFFDPREVSHGSFMPSYSYLFRSGKGHDLVTYLGSLRLPSAEEEPASPGQHWSLSQDALAHAAAARGQRLYNVYCMTCHDAQGATRTRWSAEFVNLPPLLEHGEADRRLAALTSRDRTEALARIVKYGRPGTDMPGHEYLSDADVVSLALWLDTNLH